MASQIDQLDTSRLFCPINEILLFMVDIPLTLYLYWHWWKNWLGFWILKSCFMHSRHTQYHNSLSCLFSCGSIFLLVGLNVGVMFGDVWYLFVMHLSRSWMLTPARIFSFPFCVACAVVSSLVYEVYFSLAGNLSVHLCWDTWTPDVRYTWDNR